MARVGGVGGGGGVGRGDECRDADPRGEISCCMGGPGPAVRIGCGGGDNNARAATIVVPSNDPRAAYRKCARAVPANGFSSQSSRRPPPHNLPPNPSDVLTRPEGPRCGVIITLEGCVRPIRQCIRRRTGNVRIRLVS